MAKKKAEAQQVSAEPEAQVVEAVPEPEPEAAPVVESAPARSLLDESRDYVDGRVATVREEAAFAAKQIWGKAEEALHRLETAVAELTARYESQVRTLTGRIDDLEAEVKSLKQDRA